VAPPSSVPTTTIGLVTLGCDKNTVDSERYLAELAGCGARLTANLAQADVILVNTCGFIDAAKRESIDALIEAGRFKSDGRCRAVVAVGCMVERHRAELADAMPEIDLFLGTSEAAQLVPALTERGLLAATPALRHPGVRVYAGDLPHVRYLKVSEGCDHGCAFCAIPLMRGRHRSFAAFDVVREAQVLELQGAREVNLVAQDLAHYGRDRRDGVRLAELLATLIAETSIPWIRLLYVYSAGLDARLLDVVAREPRIVKYVDMPIQHGSDPVLERMRRPERAATIRSTVARLRDAVPGVAIRTTCIVGFPGETEDDVARLLELLEDVQFERVGVFTYSAQEGTRAHALRDDVPLPLKRDRLERVTELQRVITGDRYERRVGATAQAIVDRRIADPMPADWTAAGGASSAGAQARLSWQADDIDGVTYLDRSDLEPGAIVEVRVDEVVDDYDFRASVRRLVSQAPSPTERRRARRELPMAVTGQVAGPTSVGSFGR
jgi:ribosomal protein S12 methylthiotransferase